MIWDGLGQGYHWELITSGWGINFGVGFGVGGPKSGPPQVNPPLPTFATPGAFPTPGTRKVGQEKPRPHSPARLLQPRRGSFVPPPAPFHPLLSRGAPGTSVTALPPLGMGGASSRSHPGPQWPPLLSPGVFPAL